MTFYLFEPVVKNFISTTRLLLKNSLILSTFISHKRPNIVLCT